MDDDRSELGSPSAEADDFGSFAELEERVLGLVEQLREARTKRVEAEQEAERLRAELSERDKQGKAASDGVRDAIKKRVEALLKKVAALERAG